MQTGVAVGIYDGFLTCSSRLSARTSVQKQQRRTFSGNHGRGRCQWNGGVEHQHRLPRLRSRRRPGPVVANYLTTG